MGERERRRGKGRQGRERSPQGAGAERPADWKMGPEDVQELTDDEVRLFADVYDLWNQHAAASVDVSLAAQQVPGEAERNALWQLGAKLGDINERWRELALRAARADLRKYENYSYRRAGEDEGATRRDSDEE